MKKNQDKYIYVSVYLYNIGWVSAGVLTFNEVFGYSSFSYFSEYINKKYPVLNPSRLNYRLQDDRHFINDEKHHLLDKTFWEMLPQQNDWGNQILNSRYPQYQSMNYAQKLYFIGNKIAGGLHCYVKDKDKEENINTLEWLDKVREESILFHEKQIPKISQITFLKPLTSYGGVRPKTMYKDDDGNFWIAKFNLPNDHYDMAIAEQIAMEMTKDCGLNVAESKVITLPSGENVFLSKRFDREGHNRFHSLSLFSLTKENDVRKKMNFPGHSSSYLIDLVSNYTDFKDESTSIIITKLLIDLGFNNTDNHLRNIRILLNKDLKWEIAPMYDIVFNPLNQNHIYNPSGLPLKESYLDNPNLVESMSKEFNVSEDLIQKQLNKVSDVCNNIEYYLDKYPLSEEHKNKIRNAISLGKQRKNIQQKEITPQHKFKPKH